LRFFGFISENKRNNNPQKWFAPLFVCGGTRDPALRLLIKNPHCVKPLTIMTRTKGQDLPGRTCPFQRVKKVFLPRCAVLETFGKSF